MAADWHVTYQDSRPDVRTNGTLKRVKDVHFRIDTDPGAGHEDMVSVDEDMYTADNVRALIEDKVATIKATFGL